MKYYIGPWKWVVEHDQSYYAPPASAVGCIDLGLLSEMGAGGADRPGCLCWTGRSVLGSEYDLLGDGDCREITTSALLLSKFQRAVRHRPAGDRLHEMILDCLISGGDPDGQSSWLPIVPGTDGWMDVWMPGHGRVIGERFEWGRIGSRGSNHTARIKQFIRRQFAQVFQDAKDGKLRDDQHHLRILDAWCDKYGLQGPDDWKELVPANLQPEVPGRVRHETSISESFNKANSTTLGPDLSWTEVIGDLQVSSNACISVSGGGSVSRARADSDLSSSDHYAQASCTASSSASRYAGPCARYATAADTCYISKMGDNFLNNLIIAKCVTGTITNLNTTAITKSAPDTIKLECNGSALKDYQGGVLKNSITDTSIASGTRCGVGMAAGSPGNEKVDDFAASDIAPSGTIYTQLERYTRGLHRGIYNSF